MSQSTPTSAIRYVTPGASRWLFDVFRYRHLLSLLLKKGTTTRYYGSVLGWTWSYVRPAAQFFMYYFMIGQVLGMQRSVELFPIYLFSGIVLLNFFGEATRAATNSITGNAALVKKIYLPRELFPVAAVGSAFIHFIPQVILLFVVCLFFGWHFTWLGLLYFAVALIILLVFTLGLGLFFGSINVAYRDAKNIIDVALMFAVWMSPVLYSHAMIRDVLPAWLYNLYLVNPVTVSVELFHSAFYRPIVPNGVPVPDYMFTNTLAGLGIAIGTLLIGQVVFRKLEGDFAQDL
ncbi:ABC transporter permease [Leucobacter triazinivorans]|uniref:Transport permease protein n=1 Tax=Leucobacter triazinivorans TaxID=1784719 RepID=A0A4P6KEL5_9MICO|nr:ABC transporter permease [Leucobacter triazinivorans]QBE48643.1 ABC transporter permease [Leucobacter triazinivorans]